VPRGEIGVAVEDVSLAYREAFELQSWKRNSLFLSLSRQSTFPQSRLAIFACDSQALHDFRACFFRRYHTSRAFRGLRIRSVRKTPRNVAVKHKSLLDLNTASVRFDRADRRRDESTARGAGRRRGARVLLTCNRKHFPIRPRPPPDYNLHPPLSQPVSQGSPFRRLHNAAARARGRGFALLARACAKHARSRCGITTDISENFRLFFHSFPFRSSFEGGTASTGLK